MMRPWEPPTPLEYFATLVERDADFPLFEAAVCLGQDEYPDLDYQAVVTEVDRLCVRVRRRIPDDASSLQRLQILSQFFFRELGFGVNVNDYYEPDNSYIHKVLETRRGIPVSLGVLWLEIASNIGLSVRGVSFPGHFLVKVNLPIGQAIIDPATGKSLSAEQLSEMASQVQPDNAPLSSWEVAGSPILRSAQSREILARMLRNLKGIFEAHGDWTRMLSVQERLIVLLPEVWSEYRDRGLTHAALGHSAQAVADLECYLVHTDELDDSEAIAERIETLRASR
jgi:regulator of sirC expression with transglutaminase-like and TPR domain